MIKKMGKLGELEDEKLGFLEQLGDANSQVLAYN